MTETEIMDANEHLDYQNEEAAGHDEGRQAAIDAEIEALIADAPNNRGTEFVPTDAAGVDWVLGKMAAARAEAKLIRENAEMMARECERKAEHLEWKFGPALQAYLRAELAGTTRRTKRLLHGVLGFRAKPAHLSLNQQGGEALAFAQEHAPETLTSRVDAAAFAKRFTLRHDGLVDSETGECFLPPVWLTETPAEEVFFIK